MVTPCALLPPALQLGASEERVRYRPLAAGGGTGRASVATARPTSLKLHAKCATTKGNLTNL